MLDPHRADLDRFPRRMDCGEIHMSRSEVGIDWKRVRMNRERIDIGPQKTGMNEKTIHMNRKMVG
jgi:hypothetical protein